MEPIYKSITPADRWLITIVVMAATLMQVIDTTIVNVALPHMQGSLGASPDEITWTLTSYLVSSAIFMPLTGYLADTLGRKKYLVLSIVGFTVVSGLCGAATSLPEMVVFRLLQGVFGAALVPLSQAIMTDIFPPEERGKAMAIWGVGVMVGPILGPTLGGYLTEVASWRWTFYVNVPVGIFTLLLTNVIPEWKAHPRGIDWLGLMYISFTIGGLQYVLDRGNSADWFNSTSICIITYLTISSFFFFILHNINRQGPRVFDLRIFKDSNFTLACVLLCLFGLGMYGMMVVQPLMTEGLFNYPVLTAGLLMAPRGISSMVSMIIITRLITRVDPRILIAIGICFCIIGLWFCTFYSINVNTFWLVFPMIIQGLGLGMVFVPLATIAFSTLPGEYRTEAAGLYSLVRTIGGSIGISVTMTFYTRKAQLFWNQLGGFIQPFNPAFHQYLQSMHLNTSTTMNTVLLSAELMRQSNMMSFLNVFAFIMWCFIVMLPMLLLLKKNKAVTVR